MPRCFSTWTTEYTVFCFTDESGWRIIVSGSVVSFSSRHSDKLSFFCLAVGHASVAVIFRNFSVARILSDLEDNHSDDDIVGFDRIAISEIS